MGMEPKLNISQRTPRAYLKVNQILIFKDRNLFFHDDISVKVVTNVFAERNIHLPEF
jgi:hypothetical protein